MNIPKIFIATLLLGTLASVAMIIFSYTTTYSLVPRSIVGYSASDSPDEEAAASSSVNNDSAAILNRHTNEHKHDKPKEFSLRELQQNKNFDRKPDNPEPKVFPNIANPNSNDSPKEPEMENKQTNPEPNVFPDIVNPNDLPKEPEIEKKIAPNNDVNPSSDHKSVNLPNLNNSTNSHPKIDQEDKTIHIPSKNHTTSMQIYQPKNQCEPHKNIVLLKTHKTGSSTLQNILYRFGDVRGLSFVLPAVDVYMGNPAYFHPKFVLQTPGGYNILANHARFHKENMARIMPANTKYISILRYPPKQFESMFSYYSFNNRYHTSLEGFASRAQELYDKHEGGNPRHSGLNPVLYDLGLHKNDLATPDKIDDYIKFIEDSFDLILIAEYLKESLILLKELMCWDMEEIVYFSSNKRDNSLVKEIPKQTEKHLLTWHAGDFKLYLHFNRTLHRQIEEYGVQRMQTEVKILNKMIDDLSEDCLQGTKSVSELGGKTVIKRYVLKPNAKNKRTCARMTYPAYDYLMMLKQKQKLRRPGLKRNL
ncbi:galactosylceramide sulfotransferase-like isoform X2 [Amphiura filiformis]|uniref:galactosylceramide sulfotransferase-like isoform X2 n=1 Tax=Amphiura filiformis TaxID=82378 RepID=UPI003B218615